MSDIEVCVQRLRALADPGRLHIVTLLFKTARTVGEAAELTGLSVVNTSYHLGVLFDVGIVDRRAEGRHVLYWLRPGLVDGDSLDVGYGRLRFPKLEV
jgi:DNA-binding transcriptional ArsR family regulator